MILYDTEYLQLKSTKFLNNKEWVYAHRPNASDVVVILPIIDNKEILFLIEKRPPLIAENISEFSVALPAGLVGDERTGETVEDAINAELLEEAGLKADKIVIKTRKLASSPGCVSETITIALAYINEYNIISAPVSDGGIITDRILVGINDVFSWLRQKENEGFAITSSTLAALFYLFEKEKV